MGTSSKMLIVVVADTTSCHVVCNAPTAPSEIFQEVLVDERLESSQRDSQYLLAGEGHD